jgi:isopentenyl-diphosphate delta-isomerase
MNDEKEQVILVDEHDNEIGKTGKLAAHLTGQLHRAFSIFIFNRSGQMLIHKRAESKYHTPGLWTNTCCSHQSPGEKTLEAADRRLIEEMGFRAPVEEYFHFVYKVEFGNGLTEYELDHVLVGYWDGTPSPNPSEVSDWKWIEPEEVMKDLRANPQKFTPWFGIAMPKLYFQMNLDKAS